jgi:hypothetical protein
MSTSGEKRREVVVEQDRVRRPQGTAFGWIDARIKSDGWLGVLGPEAVAAYTFLCLAANHQGVSWYTRARIGGELGLSDGELWETLDRLEALDLVAYKPFSTYAVDGWRQVLTVPPGGPRACSGTGRVVG